MLKAKYNFVACYRDEIPLHEGQIVKLIEKKQGWSLVQVEGGKGHVPTSYLTDLDIERKNDTTKVLKSQSMEFPVDANQRNGWKRMIRQLSFPTKYFRLATKSVGKSNKSSSSSKAQSTLNASTKDRAPQHHMDPKASLKEEKSTSTISSRNARMAQIRQTTSYEEDDQSDSDDTISEDDEEHLVVFNHQASKSKDDHEISVSKGELVRVIEADGEDERWYWVVNESMEEGFVPSNCLVKMNEVSPFTR